MTALLSPVLTTLKSTSRRGVCRRCICPPHLQVAVKSLPQLGKLLGLTSPAFRDHVTPAGAQTRAVLGAEFLPQPPTAILIGPCMSISAAGSRAALPGGCQHRPSYKWGLLDFTQGPAPPGSPPPPTHRGGPVSRVCQSPRGSTPVTRSRPEEITQISCSLILVRTDRQEKEKWKGKGRDAPARVSPPRPAPSRSSCSSAPETHDGLYPLPSGPGPRRATETLREGENAKDGNAFSWPAEPHCTFSAPEDDFLALRAPRLVGRRGRPEASPFSRRARTGGNGTAQFTSCFRAPLANAVLIE